MFKPAVAGIHDTKTIHRYNTRYQERKRSEKRSSSKLPARQSSTSCQWSGCSMMRVMQHILVSEYCPNDPR